MLSTSRLYSTCMDRTSILSIPTRFSKYKPYIHPSLSTAPISHRLYSTKFDRTSLIKEYEKNLEYYYQVRGLYPRELWLGIVNQKVVSQSYFPKEVEKDVQEALKKWSGGEFIEADPSVVLLVDNEHYRPQVIVIEANKPSLFHPTQQNFLDWNEVATPLHNELQISKGLDKYWTNTFFVGPNYRPYISLAVSLTEEGPCFPMTFLVDTGSVRNYIKRSAFDNIRVLREKLSGEKCLYIGGKEFTFSKPNADSIHNNINLLGTDCLYSSHHIVDAVANAMKLSEGEKNKIWVTGRKVPPENKDWE